MVSHETNAVMKVLGKDKARFVGGCVRNMLMGYEVEDIDIATQWKPKEVMEKLQKAGIKVFPTGIDHGTVTAVINKRHFEITTLRRDIETDGRRAVIAFTEHWTEDAQRRDFTMNTLLADQAGNIYDPTNTGLKDLAAGKVRFVGDAKTRIAEDYLRILRFFRFYALYGRGAPDKAALAACRRAAGKIGTLSKERITQEFFRIVSMENPADTLSLMFKNNILKSFVPPNYDPEMFSHLCDFQNRYGLAFIAARLLALAGLREKNIQKMEKLLLIPKVFKRDIEAISKILQLPDMDNDHAVRVAVYRHGRTATAQALMIGLAQDRIMNGYAPKALRVIQKWEIPQLPVDGHDLIRAGIKKGPELGRALARIEDWWIAQDFRPDRKACLQEI